jgi:hypothetical protein
LSKLSPESRYVILHIAPGHGRGVRHSPLIVQNDGDRFQLRDDIGIERLDEQFAKDIQKACEPPHHNIDVRAHDRHLYAFVRRVPEIENSTHEEINELFTTVIFTLN